MASNSLALAPDVGSRGPWVRDLCLVGGATAVGAPLAALVSSGFLVAPEASLYLATSGLVGLGTGALLGAVTPRLVAWKLGRLPRIAFLGIGLATGAAWGALVGAVAGQAVAPHTGAWALSALMAAPVGALQLGWFWVGSTQRRVRRRPVGGMLAAAALLAPVLGLAVLRCFGG
jgi:hypothetical protein